MRIRRLARPSPDSWRRGLSTLLLLGLVSSQAGQLAHALAVQHETCPEHGELIHAENQPTPARARQHIGGPGIFEGAQGPHEDHHCGVFTLWRTAPSATESHPIALVVPAPELKPLETQLVGVATKRLLRLAPKSSPPGALLS